MLFASMKETGMVAEFCPEQARFYIARQRVKNRLSPDQSLTLNDEDHYEIMKAQVDADEVLVAACGEKATIVSDSSPLNSMLYMTPDFRNSPSVKMLALRSLAVTDLSFYVHPIYRPYLEDPNRIHGEEQSRLIDSKIPELLSMFPEFKTVEVSGKVSERLLLVQSRVFFP